MSIIVTGGAGFIGSHLVDFLIENSTENIIIYDNFSRGLYRNIEQHINNSKISIIDGNINDEELLKNVIKKNDTVFHLAAEASVLVSIKNEALTFYTNVFGIISIISGQGVFGEHPLAKNTRLPRFIEMILFLVHINYLKLGKMLK